jgi:DNA polymerase III gamma/tau subunit
MNNGYDVNQALQSIFQMKNAGRNPQQIMQMLIQRNPQYSQMLTQIKNMSQGRSTKEFVMQLAKQNGVNEHNMAQLMQMFGNN